MKYSMIKCICSSVQGISVEETDKSFCLIYVPTRSGGGHIVCPTVILPCVYPYTRLSVCKLYSTVLVSTTPLKAVKV